MGSEELTATKKNNGRNYEPHHPISEGGARFLEVNLAIAKANFHTLLKIEKSNIFSKRG